MGGSWASGDTPQPGASLKTGQLKSITRESIPDTVAVSFGYDGPLLTSETWSGAVSGRVEHAYNNAFRETLERVQVGTAPAESSGYAYDHDGFVVRVGPMRGAR